MTKISFQKNKFSNYKITSKEAAPITMVDKNVLIFGDIGAWWTLSKADVYMILNNTDANDTLHFYINSDGGDLIEALVIYDLLRAHPAKKVAHLTGLVASAATIIACACDEVEMSEQTMYMIHEAQIGAWGNKRELRKQATLVESFENRAIAIYERFTGLSRDAIMELVEEETYMEPSQALELGFVTSVVDSLELDFELEKTNNINGRYYDYYDYYYKGDGYDGVVESCIKNKVFPLSPKRSLTILNKSKISKIQNSSKMKKIFNKAFFAHIISLLVTGKFLDAKDQDKITNHLAESETLGESLGEEAIATTLETIVSESGAADSASTETELTTEQLVGLINDMSDEDRALVNAALNPEDEGEGDAGGAADAGGEGDAAAQGAENNNAEMAAQMTAMRAEIANMANQIAGNRTFKIKNTTNGSTTNKEKTNTPKPKVNSAKLQMYNKAYANGNITAEQYKKYTGQDAPVSA